MFELEKTADIIAAMALDQPQRALRERIAGFTRRKYAGQVLFAQIDDRDQFGVAADAAIVDFPVHVLAVSFPVNNSETKSWRS